jgi:hypothetical protein
MSTPTALQQSTECRRAGWAFGKFRLSCGLRLRSQWSPRAAALT